jgi:periplasmic divalent cation tolerance protein
LPENIIKSKRLRAQHMSEKDKVIVLMTTTSGVAEAEKIAAGLVREKLAACAQVVPQITSFYFWDGEVRKDEEWLLLVKTATSKFDQARQYIAENHSYTVPEVVAIEAVGVSELYENWLMAYLN